MILVVDNYDSFTYNLVQYLGELGETVRVERNDAVSVADVIAMAPDAVVLSPGPCTPAEAGVCVPLVREVGSFVPILGVCLGHQAIGAAYGGTVIRAPRGVMHGKTSKIRHNGAGLFNGLPSPLSVMRYHSLVVSRDGLPGELVVDATSEDDESEIHALHHCEHPVWGVQFHPESILTERGKEILSNFLTLARLRRPATV